MKQISGKSRNIWFSPLWITVTSNILPLLNYSLTRLGSFLKKTFPENLYFQTPVLFEFGELDNILNLLSNASKNINIWWVGEKLRRIIDLGTRNIVRCKNSDNLSLVLCNHCLNKLCELFCPSPSFLIDPELNGNEHRNSNTFLSDQSSYRRIFSLYIYVSVWPILIQTLFNIYFSVWPILIQTFFNLWYIDPAFFFL